MKRPWLKLFLLSVILSLVPYSASAAELVTYTSIRSGTLKIIFKFEEGKEAWVAPLVAEAATYITLAEQFLSRPFPYRDYIEIQGCHECTSRRDGRVIYLDYAQEPTTNPALLFHELNHFWFFYWGKGSSEEWLIEGISSFLPVLLRQSGLLPDLERYHSMIDRWWGLSWFPSEDFKDTPLYPFTEKKRSVVYHKSYRLQYLINCILGKNKYRRFVREIASSKHRKNNYVIQLLNKLTRRNWRKFLSGWVLGSSYKEIPISDFWNDSDADGLGNALEFCVRSDKTSYDTDGDLLPDGAEVKIGTNPRVANPDALTLLNQYGPFIDGSSFEWNLFSTNLLNDPAGDNRGPAWADLLEMHYLIKGKTLFLQVNTAAAPEPESQVFFDILVDTDLDGGNNEEFAFWLRNPASAWQYHSATGISNMDTMCKSARGAVIEMSVPLDEIPTDSFRILPIIRNDSSKLNYDQWNEWIEIQK